MAVLSGRALWMRVSMGLVWYDSVISAAVDPYAQLSPVDVVHVGPLAAARVPDFRFDDLRAARQESSHDWRVACAFEARGPPV